MRQPALATRRSLPLSYSAHSYTVSREESNIRLHVGTISRHTNVCAEQEPNTSTTSALSHSPSGTRCSASDWLGYERVSEILAGLAVRGHRPCSRCSFFGPLGPADVFLRGWPHLDEVVYIQIE